MLKKILIAIAIVLAIFIVIAIVFMFKMRPVYRELTQVRQMSISEFDLNKLPDGVYPGDFTCAGFTLLVEVTIKDNKIANVKLLNNRTTKYAKKGEGVIERIIQKQSPNVDAITGATTTSKAIMKAVENALNKATLK